MRGHEIRGHTDRQCGAFMVAAACTHAHHMPCRNRWQEAHGGEVPAELLQPAAVAAAAGDHVQALVLLQGASASLLETALARALARAAAKQQEADVMALLALQAPAAGEAGGEGRAKWEKGDLVVLRPALDEEKGLKAGEAAAVSYGPDSDGDYRVKRASDGKELEYFKAADFVTTTPLRVAARTGSVPIVSAMLAKLKARWCGCRCLRVRVGERGKCLKPGGWDWREAHVERGEARAKHGGGAAL